MFVKSRQMKFQLAVFDLAGTTVKDNRDVHRVLRSALSRHGVDITLDEANEVMGIPKPIAIRQLLSDHPLAARNVSEDWINEIHEDFLREMVAFYQQDAGVSEKIGVSETFEALHKLGLKVAVDTGFDRKITDALLQRLGWAERGLIDFSVTSDEVERGRPFPDMIFRAMAQFGIKDAASVIKIGDTGSDIQEGRAAGCGMLVAVTTGAFSVDQLIKENPHFLIGQLPEILPLLDSLHS